LGSNKYTCDLQVVAVPGLPGFSNSLARSQHVYAIRGPNFPSEFGAGSEREKERERKKERKR